MTGVPGAGKTALLEMIRQSFCTHVRILPEAASVVFGGASLDRVQRALEIIRGELPDCCERHDLDALAKLNAGGTPQSQTAS